MHAMCHPLLYLPGGCIPLEDVKKSAPVALRTDAAKAVEL